MNIPLMNLKAQYAKIQDEIQQAVNRVLESANFIMGPDVAEFESEFARFCRAKHCLSVANGTDALTIVLKAFELQPGDRVLTAAHTFIASAECISHAGGVPVFVDIDPQTYLMDSDKLEAKVKELKNRNIPVKGIVAVQLFGQPCDMDAIAAIAERYGLFVVEDAAQAHGAEYKGKRVGGFGAAATFSFYPGKNLGAYGDAGAIVTNDDKIARLAEMYRNHGRARSMKYDHEIEGFNSRLDTLQAAILRVKLKYLEDWNAIRIQNAAIYNSYLRDVPEVTLPVVAMNAKHVYYVYTIRVPHRDELKKHLEANGIATGIYYPLPLHLQPAYRYLGYSRGSLPGTEKAAVEILSLPLDAEISREEISYVCAKVADFFRK